MTRLRNNTDKEDDNSTSKLTRKHGRSRSQSDKDATSMDMVINDGDQSRSKQGNQDEDDSQQKVKKLRRANTPLDFKIKNPKVKSVVHVVQDKNNNSTRNSSPQ